MDALSEIDGEWNLYIVFHFIVWSRILMNENYLRIIMGFGIGIIFHCCSFYLKSNHDSYSEVNYSYNGFI